MGEEVLRQNLDGAFAPPSDFPDPRLLSRTMSAISSGVALPEPVGRPARSWLPPAALQWAAVVMVIVIAGTATVAAFLALHRAPAPGRAITAPVIFPTKMVSPTTGWAVTSHGSSQQAWRTSDGGLSWTEVTPKSAIDHDVSAYTNYFLDESHAWITEMAGGSASTAAYLVTFRTTDGGKTWQRGTPLNAKVQSMLSEDFLDASSGWLAITSGDMTHRGWPDVYATTDGGLHWSLEASRAGADLGSGNLVPGGAEPSFISPTAGWLTVGLYAGNGNGSFFFSRTAVLATHDGGRTWRPQSLPVQPAEGAVVDAPAFFGQKQGVMVMHAIDPNSAVKAILFATSDGGATWTGLPLEWAYISSIEFVDRNHGWAVAGPGSDFTKSSGGQTIPLPLYRTDDGGVTWKAVTTSLDLQAGRDRVTDIHFVDQTTGFATIWNDSGPTEALRSDDGGRSWSVVARCATPLGLGYPPPTCPASK